MRTVTELRAVGQVPWRDEWGGNFPADWWAGTEPLCAISD